MVRSLALFLASFLTVLGSCGSKPHPTEFVNGTVSGHVYVTAPVDGALVSIYAWDPATNTRGFLLAQAETDLAGFYTADLGAHHGGLLVLALGSDAAYIEPASGERIEWSSSTALRGVFVDRMASEVLRFELERGEDVTVDVSLWSDVALAYAESRANQNSLDRLDVPEAFQRAFNFLAEHLELDFWEVVPASVTAGPVGGWQDRAQLGVLTAGISALALRMATDSGMSPNAVSGLDLLAILREDLADKKSLLDGEGPLGLMAPLGSCATVCTPSSKTLRSHWAASIADMVGSERNASGITVTDVRSLLQRISSRRNRELFPDAGSEEFDTTPPIVTIEGLVQASVLSGPEPEVVTLTAFDAVAMGTLTFELREGDQTGPLVTRAYVTTIEDRTEQSVSLSLSIDSTALLDGAYTFIVRATDDARNPAEDIVLSIFVNNTGDGQTVGMVWAGGPVAGARVSVYEFNDAVKGVLLGEGMTSDDGVYSVTIPDTAATTLLVQASNPGTGPAAEYVEPASDWTVTFSSDDVLESILADWQNGQIRTDGIVSPYTTMGVALAVGIWESDQRPASLRDAIQGTFGAFTLMEDHFAEGNTRINLRAVQPADLTRPGVSTLTAQARYGLLLCALSELAFAHANASGVSPASVNTLSLTTRLAEDLGKDNPSLHPIFDGRTGAGTLTSGNVALTSYVTRLDLAVNAVKWLELNPRDQSPFVELDVAPLLDHISTDDNPRLYPSRDVEPPIPYDTTAPSPVTFVAPTPAEGAVLRGDRDIQVEATDNRALASLEWTTPATVGAITNTLVDRTAGVAGPWLLSGKLHTDVLPEGSLTLTARAVDEAGRATEVTHQLVIDRTSPTVTIDRAELAGGIVLAPGGWTALAPVTISGTVDEPHVAGATYQWNGGAQEPLTVSATGKWSLGLSLAAGENTLVVRIVDRAGNQGSASGTYNRDATPPTVQVIDSSFSDDTSVTATVVETGSAWGGASYSGVSAPVLLQATGVPAFTKHAELYVPAPTFGALPRWRFLVGDNRSPASALKLWARLSRRTGTTSYTLLKDDFIVGSPTGVSGYNHEQLIHGGLHADVQLLSGRFRLEVFAEDELQNRSAVKAVEWDQTVKPPPVRQRFVPNGNCSAADVDCVLRYSPRANNMASLLNGSGQFTIARGYIDNPSALPVRVRLTTSAQTNYRVATVWQIPITQDPTSAATGTCDTRGLRDRLTTGACYTRPSVAEVRDATDRSAGDLYAGLRVEGALACGDCAAGEILLAPRSTATVHVLSNKWSFLYPGTASEVSETPQGESTLQVTGLKDVEWISCEDTRTDPDTGTLTCSRSAKRRSLHFITAAQVRTDTRVSLESRTSGNGSSWTVGGAVGTNTTNFTYWDFWLNVDEAKAGAGGYGLFNVETQQ
jgi:hypothetical protein